MSRYNKGSNAERELIHMLWNRGFAVVRAAGSGSTPLPSPDIFATNGEKSFAFECKAWDSTYLNIRKEQMDALIEWCARARSALIVAWRVSGKKWYFLRPQDFHVTEKFYAIKLDDAIRHSIVLDVLVGTQTQL